MDEEKFKKTVKIIDILPPSSARPEIKKIEEPVSPIESMEEIEYPEIPETEKIEEVKEVEEQEKIFPEGLFIPKVKKTRKRTFTYILLACIVFGLGCYFYFSLSKAEIVIKPKIETMQFQAVLNIDKNAALLDLENNEIPGQIFQVESEGEKEFSATQEKDVREKAKGIITVYNQYSSAPQTLVASTRFISDKEEKIFRTTKTIVIPGAKIEEGQIISSTIDVEVEAAEPGKDYNIGLSSFTIPGFKGTAKYAGFYGKSTQAMVGGVIGRIKVVSADDIKGAKDILIVELKEKVKKELEKRIPSDLKILKDATLEEIVESSSSVEADQPAEKFTVKIKVAVKSLGFNEKDAIALINDNLKEKIPENKSLLPDTIEIKYTIVNINLEKGIAKLTCEVREDVVWKIDTEKIKKDLAGKNEVDVRQYLASFSEIESAKVIFWPFWVKKIPSKESKIKITIDPAPFLE